MIVALAAAALAAGSPAPAQDVRAAERGAEWVTGAARGAEGGQLADAVVAVRSVRRPAGGLMARLARVAPNYARSPGAAGKVALAAVAAGRDPARLGGVDYLRRITNGYAAGRYGANAYDQALAMLALAAAGRRVPPAAVSAVRTARGAGGWNFSMSASRPDDPSTTALMLQALRAAGVHPGDRDVRAATAWMLSARNDSGGYNFGRPGGPTEANSTALVLMALSALGRPAPAGSRAALRALQRPDGSFAFTSTDTGSPLLASVDAVPALAGRHLPVTGAER
jgi:hypothetical protein